MQRRAATPWRFGTSLSIVRNAIEATWLLALILVPVAIVHETWMVGYVQIPKVFVLRSAALLLITLVALEWAVGSSRHSRAGEQHTWRVSREALMSHPAKLVYFAAGAVLLANLVSIALSPVPVIGIWGRDPGWDSYGLASVASYLVFFGVLATHLRTPAQLRRLLGALTVSASVVSLYGIGQHFGVDFLVTDAEPVNRSPFSFGNPLFGAAYLIMVLPLTFALVLTWRGTWPSAMYAGLGVGLVALQVVAILFSLSRGPWIGGFAGAVVFAVALVWVLGFRSLARPATLVVGAVAFAVALNLVPVGGDTSGGGGGGSTELGGGQVVERIASIPGAVSGGFNQRVDTWKASVDIFRTVPWVNAEQFPQIPDLGPRPLRRLVGYGPDMFLHVYPLSGESNRPAHGHNFIVHSVIELGMLGALAYVGLIVALGLVLVRTLLAARRGAMPAAYVFLVVGLTASLLSRVVEQQTGIAHVSDLHLSWVLAGAIIGVSTMNPDEWATTRTRTQELAANRRSAPAARVRQRGRRGGTIGTSLPILGAAAVSLAALVLWWQGAVPEVTSAVTAASALSSAQDGDGREAARAVVRAAGQSANPFNRLGLANGLINQQRLETGVAEKTALLDIALDHANAVLERNPMDERAWSTVIVIGNERSLLDASYGEDALRDSAALMALYPGFWQPRLKMATTLVRQGRYEDALDFVMQAKSRGGERNVGVVFLEAVSLRALGRSDEAAAVHERLENYKGDAARLLQQNYRDGAAEPQRD